MADCRNIKSAFVETVSLLYIILFIYAALNKILDFENFQVQLGQSPLLSAFAGIVSYLVPGVEFFIVFLLLIPKYRYAGLFASFCLMIMFSAYIFIMLHFSPFVPCSCGGILEKMSWNEHLLFNIAFTIMALGAILLHRNATIPHSKPLQRIRFAGTIISAVLSTLFVVVLFLLSEDSIHNRNNFTRRFPKHPTNPHHEIILPYNSYYIAGYNNGILYLGNRTAPLTVLTIFTASGKMQNAIIDLPKNDYPFTSPRLIIRDSQFYFMDGTVSCLFSGNTSDWKAKSVFKGKTYFSLLEPVSNDLAVIRATSSATKESVLATITLANSVNLTLHPDILVKQIDGVFDTDGMLLYNRQIDKVLYTYYYRNEIIIADPSLEHKTSIHTIDTTSRAKLEVATVKSRKITTLAKQAKIINKKTATFGNYLFVNAASIGKFESEQMWNMASIIDVYDITDGSYAFSFYVYDKNGVKMDEFMVADDLILSLNAEKLTIEKFQTNYYNSWNKPEKRP